MSNEITVGTMQHERDTKGTHVYSRTNENGRKETQYVLKSAFKGQTPPESIEVVIRFD